MREVVGRDAELQAGEAFLAAARSGLEALLVEGDAGIGKTTVWTEIARRAEDAGFLVLRTRAVASEAQLTLAGFADLVAPVADLAPATLPAPQRRALDAALLRSEPVGAALEPRLLGSAIRTLLDAASSLRPIVVAIDDLQWLDAGSATILAFALRRLTAAPVGILAARRSRMALPFDLEETVGADRLTTLAVRPLTVAALHHLLKTRSSDAMSRSTLVRIHQASGGNPLFALEIVRLLGEIGEPPAGSPLPVPEDLRELLRNRIGRLPKSTRRLLLAVAILGQAPLETLSAVHGGDIDVDIETAESEELIRRDGTSVAFAHPLYAAAILADAVEDDVQRLHSRLADTLDSREERARHRALATARPDSRVAHELDQVAQTALARGAPLAAADLARLAIERTPADDGDAIARRRIELGEYLKRAGEPGLAAEALRPVIEGKVAGARARARLALAAIRFETDASPAAAVALCQAAIVDAGDDIELQARAHATAAAVDWEDFRRRSEHVAEASRLIEQVSDPDPSILGLVLMERCGNDVEAGRPLDPADVALALDLEAHAAAPSVSERFSASLGTWLKAIDDFDGARRWLEQTYQSAIDEGDEGSLPYAVAHLPELELWTGNWERAEEMAQRHHALAAELGLEAQRLQALYNLALVHVHRGLEEAARLEIREGLAAAETQDDEWTESALEAVLGFLELSLGNPAVALVHLARARASRDRIGQLAPSRLASDLLEALAQTGDLDAAERLLTDLEVRAPRYRRHSALANVARSRAALEAARGDLEAAERSLEQALAEHDLVDVPFDRARTLMLRGQVRRRRRERRAAKLDFEAAHAIFERLGAPIWMARVIRELERLGIRRSSGDALTETELRVVELAASGLTNREVAAALFMSPKTVESNLSRSYQKLGIRSRAELGAVVARRDATPESPQT